MAEIVNLRTARKQAERRRKEKRAAEARAVYGISRVDRALTSKYKEKARRDLDGRCITPLES